MPNLMLAKGTRYTVIYSGIILNYFLSCIPYNGQGQVNYANFFAYNAILKSSKILMKCTYNSQYIAHYAQVELTIMLTETDMRHEETQLHYHRVQPFQFYQWHVLRFKSGLINPFPVHNMQSRHYDESQFTRVKQLLAIVCPKILKIMPIAMMCIMLA